MAKEDGRDGVPWFCVWYPPAQEWLAASGSRNLWRLDGYCTAVMVHVGAGELGAQ